MKKEFEKRYEQREKLENINLRDITTKEPCKETYGDLEDRRSIAFKDQERIDKKYNSKKFTNLRRTAEYLRTKQIDGEFILDKKKISKDLKICMGSLDIYLCELNRYLKFQPVRWIASKGKKNFIEVAGSNFDNDLDYIKRRMKELTSRMTRFTQTREKIQAKHEMNSLKEWEKRIVEQRQEIKIKNDN